MSLRKQLMVRFYKNCPLKNFIKLFKSEKDVFSFVEHYNFYAKFSSSLINDYIIIEDENTSKIQKMYNKYIKFNKISAACYITFEKRKQYFASILSNDINIIYNEKNDSHLKKDIFKKIIPIAKTYSKYFTKQFNELLKNIEKDFSL